MSEELLLDPTRAPFEVVDLDLPGDGSPPVLRRIGGNGPLRSGPVLALVRSGGRPAGLVQAVHGDVGDASDASDSGDDPHPSSAGRLTALLAAAAHRELDLGLPGPRATSALPGTFPLVTVVVATRERPQLLARCLESLEGLRYPRFDVVVVDNAPVTEATRDLVRECFGDRVRYIREPLRGLAAAHNRGLAETLGEIVAFTDDDVVVDPGWLDALVSGFVDARVGCVTGLILPARLHTRTQVLLETHGGFSKGFHGRRYRLDRPPADQPLFPFTAGRLGSGANMAFRTDVLRGLGGFDPAIGTGTPARGGDDLLSFFRVVVHGHDLVYQPEALVWHHHRDRPEDLDGQAFGYGAGLGAYLAAALLHEPRMLPALLRRLPRGVRHALASTGAETRPSWSARLSRLQRRGLLYGPYGYLRSRRLVRAEARINGPTPTREVRSHA
ncbi:GT2 family glycosyltransferase [Streptacidiphilus sp. MAP12-16]|uniref:glycosyltransferase family 2 protein n=1 Tax=Streptacidiphilus sp. MAP12-16 TaxID=3156300 RepID=UPI0035193304